MMYIMSRMNIEPVRLCRQLVEQKLKWLNLACATHGGKIVLPMTVGL